MYLLFLFELPLSSLSLWSPTLTFNLGLVILPPPPFPWLRTLAFLTRFPVDGEGLAKKLVSEEKWKTKQFGLNLNLIALVGVRIRLRLVFKNWHLGSCHCQEHGCRECPQSMSVYIDRLSEKKKERKQDEQAWVSIGDFKVGAYLLLYYSNGRSRDWCPKWREIYKKLAFCPDRTFSIHDLLYEGKSESLVWQLYKIDTF